MKKKLFLFLASFTMLFAEVTHFEINDVRQVLIKIQNVNYAVIFAYSSGAAFRGLQKYIKRIENRFSNRFAPMLKAENPTTQPTLATFAIDIDNISNDTYNLINTSLDKDAQFLFYDNNQKVYDSAEPGSEIDIATFASPDKFIAKAREIFGLPAMSLPTMSKGFSQAKNEELHAPKNVALSPEVEKRLRDADLKRRARD